MAAKLFIGRRRIRELPISRLLSTWNVKIEELSAELRVRK
jgi:hypothetical protein